MLPLHNKNKWYVILNDKYFGEMTHINHSFQLPNI